LPDIAAKVVLWVGWLLSPIIAAAMSFSSVSVIINVLWPNGTKRSHKKGTEILELIVGATGIEPVTPPV